MLLPGFGREVIEQMIEAMIAKLRRCKRAKLKLLFEIISEKLIEFNVFFRGAAGGRNIASANRVAAIPWRFISRE